MKHADDIAAAIAASGLSFTEMRRVDGQPFSFALYQDVTVEAGRLRGMRLTLLAVPIPDDAMLPPPGIHTQPHLGLKGSYNIHESPLGPDWAYWSRPILEYTPTQGVPRILSHIQSVFRDV